MKESIILFFLLFFSILTFAQSKEEIYYFVTKTDTVHCAKLEYLTTMQGFLGEMEYTDLNGKEIKIKGRKKVPDVLTFYMNGTIFDKVPLKANKPNGYIRYVERRVNGKLIIYLDVPSFVAMTPGSFTPTSSFSGYGHSGRLRFFIKFPDGTLYKANSKSNMKKYIKPYIVQCGEFVAKYDGKYSTDSSLFIDMVKLYNSLCGTK